MRLIFIGPPGSGKGTQTKLLHDRLGLLHIGTGDILREAVQRNSPAGQLVKPFVEKGLLVPDHIVNEIVHDLFHSENCPRHFVMDGYPRTLTQAQAFDGMLHELHLDLDGVILLAVPDEDIIRRLSGRWTCPGCKATFHMVFKPPRQEGVCDRCNSRLIQRDDDTEATVRNRLNVFHSQTDILVDYYRKKNLLREVPGLGSIETIYANILKALEKK